MLTLDRTLADRPARASIGGRPDPALDETQRARLRSLLGQTTWRAPEPVLDPRVRRGLPLVVPLLAVLMALTILLIWTFVF
jgi:hypothetical protein